MPTRAEFLANGLVTVALHSIARNETCNICFAPFTSPVQLPCNHVFDQHCITSWLNLPHRNTCPYCRRSLFTLPREEGATIVQLPAAVSRAFNNSRLLTEIPIQTYGVETLTLGSLQRAAAQVTVFLSLPQSTDTSGPTVVRAQPLASSFVAMGTLIPLFAAAQGRAYTRQQQADWDLILTNLWQIIEGRDGVAPDASVLADMLRDNVRYRLGLRLARRGVGGDVDDMDFFHVRADGRPVSTCYDDLETLLCFIKDRCAIQYDEEEAAVVAQRPLMRRVRRSRSRNQM